jgi:hypothetical protein
VPISIRGARLLSYAGIVLIVLLGSLLIAFLLSGEAAGNHLGAVAGGYHGRS